MEISTSQSVSGSGAPDSNTYQANVQSPWAGGDYFLYGNRAKSAEAVRADERQLYLNRDAQAFNSAEAEKNRAWEKMMSDSAVQRRYADLKAAGINPVLAAGTAASTPSSSAASVGTGSAHAANLEGGEKFLGSLVGALIGLAATGVSSAAKVASANISANATAGAAAARSASAEDVAKIYTANALALEGARSQHSIDSELAGKAFDVLGKAAAKEKDGSSGFTRDYGEVFERVLKRLKGQ